jgi:CheY-like chemotaxis protein
MDPHRPLEGRRILVVEDDYLVAEVLCELLEDAGATVLGPIGWVQEAVAYVEQHAEAFDCAILDVNLHGEKSYAIADALMQRELPFAFATGYGADALDGAYRHHTRCQKPFEQRALIAALR